MDRSSSLLGDLPGTMEQYKIESKLNVFCTGFLDHDAMPCKSLGTEMGWLSELSATRSSKKQACPRQVTQQNLCICVTVSVIEEPSYPLTESSCQPTMCLYDISRCKMLPVLQMNGGETLQCENPPS